MIMLTRRDWWLGVVLIVAALLVHAAVPRYTWRIVATGPAAVLTMRTDRWFGEAELHSTSASNPIARRLGN
jgi:hypothetical protein